METYDYRNKGYLDIDEQIDSLSNEERRLLNEAMLEIRSRVRQEAEERSMKWFYDAVAPILRKYAEDSEALLTLEEKPDCTVVAVLKNDVGYSITRRQRHIRAVLGLAVHTDIR